MRINVHIFIINMNIWYIYICMFYNYVCIHLMWTYYIYRILIMNSLLKWYISWSKKREELFTSMIRNQFYLNRLEVFFTNNYFTVLEGSGNGKEVEAIKISEKVFIESPFK